MKDSDGNTLSERQAEYFKDSKIRDEDGNLLVVYHGTDAEFTVFDRTKGRANMDIQGSFFSPWDIDAQGYGSNVKSYYLNITNPAPEGVAYKALNKFKGQNNAGIKAREYLESLGYDGVNNGDEEYIAFNSNQIKEISNTTPTSDPDIRNSVRDNFSNALISDEWKKYNNAMISGVDAGLRINDHSMLVECEKGDYSYKLVIYDNTFEDNPIQAIYGIGNDNYSTSSIHKVASTITDLEDNEYARNYVDKALRYIAKVHKILLSRYNNESGRYINVIRSNKSGRSNSQNKSDGTGISETDSGTVKYSLRDTYDDTKSLSKDLKKELKSSLTVTELDSYMKYLVDTAADIESSEDYEVC